MALIPSESLNFPDTFRTKFGWRVRKHRDTSRIVTADPIPKVLRLLQAADEQLNTPVVYQIARLPHPKTLSSEPAPESEPQVTPAEEEVSHHEEQLPLQVTANGIEPQVPESLGVVTEDVAADESATTEPAEHGMNGFIESDAVTACGPGIGALATPGQISSDEMNPNAPTEPSVSVSPAASEVPANLSAFVAPKDPADLDDVWSQATNQPEAAGEKLPPSTPIPVETPAQTQQLFEWIAAAVQRGSLVGEAVAKTDAPAEAVSFPSDEKERGKLAPSPTQLVDVLPQPAKVEQAPHIEQPAPELEQAPELGATTPEPSVSKTGSSSPAASQPGPAPENGRTKIRIVPRKIKPRVQMTAMEEQPPVAISAPATEKPSVRPKETRAGYAALGDVVQTTVGAPPADEEKVSPVTAPSVSPKSVSKAPPVFEAGHADVWLFTPEERRNRWIKFGVGELVAVAGLLFLIRLAFSNGFADPTFKLLVFILMFAVAAVAIALPVAFVRNNPLRWDRYR